MAESIQQLTSISPSQPGRNDHADFRRRGKRRPIDRLQLVAQRPLAPGVAVGQHLDEESADDGARVHPACSGLDRTIRIGDRITDGGLVQIIVDGRDDCFEVLLILGERCAPDRPIGFRQARA